MSDSPVVWVDLDPFDLPEWVGVGEVTWTPEAGLAVGHRVAGALSSVNEGAPVTFACDLWAVDEAYPRPVCDDAARSRAHQAWRHGQVLLTCRADRLTLAVPGTSFGPDLVLEVLRRFVRAVGASPEHYAAHLRLGG